MTTPGVNHQTTRVMAYLLDITTRRLQQLSDEGIVKPVKRGTWDLVETLHGYVRYLRDGMKGPEDTHEGRRERARLLKAQADKTELETAILRAEVIPADTVQHVWTQILGSCRARLLALPSRLAATALAAESFDEMESQARDLVDEALNELADFKPTLYRSTRSRAAHLFDGPEYPETAPQADRQPMGESESTPVARRQRRAGTVPH